MNKLLTVGIAIALLSGCAYKNNKEDFNATMNSYVGNSIDSLIALIGHPETTHETPSGHDYVFRSEAVAHGLFGESGNYCTLNVHVDKSSNIVKIDQHGSQQMSFSEEGDECSWAYNLAK